MPNIIGVRTELDIPNAFNDVIFMCFTQPHLNDLALASSLHTRDGIFDQQTLLSKWYFTDNEDESITIDGVRGMKTSQAQDKYENTIDNDRLFSYSATTDPGVYYLNNPLSNLGTAVLKPGQYASYNLGYHKSSEHPALVQTGGTVTVYRDNDKDKFREAGKEETGFFGINIHRANALATSKQIDKYSAGCQVFANPVDHTQFIRLCKNLSDYYKQKLFTYTLIEEKDLRGV